jgi:hypothetical protein
VRWALLALVAGCADRGPRLESATPSSVYNATTMNVTIAGDGMCAGDCERAAGEFVLEYDDGIMVQLPVVSLGDTSAQIAVPSGARVGPGSIVLTVNGSSSNALAFEVRHATGGVLP